MNNFYCTFTYIAFAILTLPILSYSADYKADIHLKHSAITTKEKAQFEEEKLSSLVHVKFQTDNVWVENLRQKVENYTLFN